MPATADHATNERQAAAAAKQHARSKLATTRAATSDVESLTRRTRWSPTTFPPSDSERLLRLLFGEPTSSESWRSSDDDAGVLVPPARRPDGGRVSPSLTSVRSANEAVAS